MPGMRLFDSLTVVLLAAFLICRALDSKRCAKWSRMLLVAGAIAAATHLIVEQGRWQMVPVYLMLAGSLAWAALARIRGSDARLTSRRWMRVAATVPGFVLLALTAVASWLFPLFELPLPTGQFAVGTTELYFIDTTRPEVHTANPVDKRELMVRAWYPAKVDAPSQPAPYLARPELVGAAVNQDSWPLGMLLGHLDLIPTHSYADAPVSPQQEAYPVLIFSHGLGGLATQNTVLAEDLASHGYVVVSISHTYDAMATVFPDGRVKGFSTDAYSARDSEASPELERDAERLLQSTDSKQIAALLQRAIDEQPVDAAVTRFWHDSWSRDQRFVMDQLEKLQSGQSKNLFAGRLQLDRVGVMGMSFGGNASATTCAADRRCKAGIDIDGMQPVAIETPPQQAPFMYFSNDWLSFTSVFLERDRNYRYFVKLKGSGHYDFTDAPLVSPLAKLLGAAGKIDGHRAIQITNTYIRAFFDRHLQGMSAPLLEGASQYPEVTFMGRTPRDSPALSPVSSLSGSHTGT